MAASIVVGKHGTADQAAERALHPQRTDKFVKLSLKIIDGFASELIEYWRAKGERVVFTNGCFDLLHVGT